jgi:hypothetical protein
VYSLSSNHNHVWEDFLRAEPIQACSDTTAGSKKHRNCDDCVLHDACTSIVVVLLPLALAVADSGDILIDTPRRPNPSHSDP